MVASLLTAPELLMALKPDPMKSHSDGETSATESEASLPSSRSSSPGALCRRSLAAQSRSQHMPVWVLDASVQASPNQGLPTALPWKVDVGGVTPRLVAAELACLPRVAEPPSKRLDDDLPDVSNLCALDQLLMQAVADSDVDGCRRAVAAGANVDLVTSGGKPLIFYALMRAKDAEIVKVLLAAGASVHHADSVGNRVLHLWARAKRARDELLEVGEALLAAGAVVNAQRNDGMTAMHLLAGGHNTHRDWLDFHKAMLLVRHGAHPDIVAPCGRAPVDMLKRNQRAATARFVTLCTDPTAQPRCNQPACKWCMPRNYEL